MADALRDAADLGSAFEALLRDAGGVDLSRDAEADPASRQRVAQALDGFGAWDIRPFDGAEDALYASVLCERAGGLNLPYPVAERFVASDLHQVDAVCVVDPDVPVIPHGGLALRWACISGDWLRASEEAPPRATTARIAPFATDAALRDVVADPRLREREALAHLLTSSTLLGMADSAAAATYDFVATRRQFGSPLSSFQGLRFALTDVATGLHGARELGSHALWSFTERRASFLEDALTFRIAMLEAAEVTFSRCHQAHGAIGLCDETDLSWYSRHSRVLRHAPWGITRTEQRLLQQASTSGVAGPFAG